MSDFRSIYDSISNPLDDESIIKGMINAFANEEQIYNYLVKIHVDEKKYKGRYYVSVKDDFYAKLFKIWKYNVLSLTDNQVEWLIQRGSVERDYHRLRQYLRTLPDVKTYKEFQALVNQSNNNLIEKYGWQSLGAYSGWKHVSSRYLTARKEPVLNVEHRLYLNTESIHTEMVTSMFVDKCIKKGIPFYFKYDDYGNRDDTIVIYSDTEHLSQYIDILREIKKENAKVFTQIHQPPILTGKIDGWIGYGAEPAKLPNGERTSFNAIRSKAIERAIKKCRNKWIFDHKNNLVSYMGKRITLSEYLAIKVTDKVVERYHKNMESYINRGKEKQFYDIYGLVDNDFTNGNIKKVIKYYVDKNINQFINSLMNSSQQTPTINIPTRDGKKINLYDTDFTSVFTSMVHQILKNDSSFVQTVTKTIKQESKLLGIDTDKYCFDIVSRDKLFTYKVPTKETQASSNFVEQKKVMEHMKGKNNSDKKQVVDIGTICDKFNPTLLKRRVRYPNGAETSAKQYIQEYLYPFIPSDGFFTLKNGARIPYQQYIEEFVMYEGQKKYNGDAVRLIEATTRNNRGVIFIQDNNGRMKNIHPVQITDYLNPLLMKRKMRYPNGAETSAKQYIEEYFSPFIPTNGRIILKNGTEISAKQYIEKILMFEGQTKYNGDVGLILQATTRNNNGTISFDWKKEYQKQIEIEIMLNDVQEQMTTGKGIRR